MKLNLWIASIIISCCMVNHAHAQELTNAKDSLSYAAGLVLGEKLSSNGIEDIDLEKFSKAIDDMLNKYDLQINRGYADQIFQTAILEQKKKMKAENKANGEAFLEENAKREEVTVLPSGLQYEVVNYGEGASPNPGDTVITHYVGTLIDGTEFDSSVRRGEPLTFGLNRVIKAWQEALPLMKVGSKWKIYAPYNLAYGERGAGAKILPYSALIFEIELLGIQ